MTDKKETKILKEEELNKVSGGYSNRSIAYCYDCKEAVDIYRNSETDNYKCSQCNGTNLGEY